MPNTKDGEEISWKEFIERWKGGISNITPSQKIKIQLKATYIQLIGIIAGLVISTLNFKTLWWVALILFGALIITLIQLLGLKQQDNQITKLEEFSVEEELEDVLE